MQRPIQFLAVMTFAAFATWSFGQDSDQSLPSIEIDLVQLKIAEQVDVPAEQSGVLRKILVQEGNLVREGEAVAQVDDASARLTEQRAEVDLDIARRMASDRMAVELALKKAEQERQKLTQERLNEQIAAKLAENTFKVLAAQKAHAVAQNELQRAKTARQISEIAVSKSEIEGLTLEAEKADLESQQFAFETDIDALKHEVQQENLKSQELAVGRAELEIAQAESDLEVAAMQARLKEHELSLARLDLERRRITSSIDGVVVELYRNRGEWVEPGEPVMRILRLNRLWAEGFLKVDDLSKCVEHSPVVLTVKINEEETVELPGRIVFVGREVDPVNRDVLVRAEIENENFQLLPGMEGRLEIHPQRPVTSTKTASAER